MRGYSFDIRRFIRDMGGVTEVRRRLMAHGIDVGVGTVKKWRERNSMDVVYIVNLLAQRTFEEGPLDFYAYVTADDNVRAPRRPPPPAPTGASPRSATASRG